MTISKDIIKRLCDVIDSKLSSRISSENQKVALVDFPKHSNVGDSAIALGELEWFKKNSQLRLAYICDIKRYDKDCLKNIVGDGTIFIHGGGNLGDIWPMCQQFREKIIHDFPENRIIQFPQTIYFQTDAALERSKKIFNDHKRLTLLVRDQQSLQFAQENFQSDIDLCPDMAFYIGPVKRKTKPEADIAALMRTDKEIIKASCFKLPDNSLLLDWIEEPQTFDLRVNKLLIKMFSNHRAKLEFTNHFMINGFTNLARHRFERGCRILEKGKIVCTDRLHGHIMALLLDIPHFLSDNFYGKLRNFHSCWTSDSDITCICTPTEQQKDIYSEAERLGWIS